jgi:hypothetical protein
VEADIAPQVEAPAPAAVEDLPGLGEIGPEVAVLVLGDQAVQRQLEDPARRLVGGDARIELERRALERHGERVVARQGERRGRAAHGERGEERRDQPEVLC